MPPLNREVSTEALQDAIRNLHGCESMWVEAVPVKEVFNGETVWEGEVQVFDLIGSDDAPRAYAWTSAVDGSDTRRRFVVVLHKPPVNSPLSAVQASIAAQYDG